MAIKELDYFEYTSDEAAQAAYDTNAPTVLNPYSEASIKQQGSYAMKVVAIVNASPVTLEFTSSQNWVCPEGVDTIDVECWGGGAGGQKGSNGPVTYAAGGGAYSKKINISVIPGQQYTIVVGAGGADGEGGYGAVGGAGGDSYFNNITTVLAKGGAGQGSPSGGQASAGVGDTKYSGGNGGATYSGGGGGGSSAGTGANGNNGSNGNGAGGAGGSAPTGGGAGGNGGVNNDISLRHGNPGNAPGGGGGGGAAEGANYGPGNGGSGATGKIKITYTVNSLNKTLIRTISPVIDLYGHTLLKFYIRSNRTGSNIQIGIRDSGGVESNITPNILSSNTWQQVEWDISNIANANKNAIDRIIIRIVNNDANNTFYIDDFYSYFVPAIISIADLNIELRDKDGKLKTYLTPFVTAINWNWNRLGGCGDCSITLNKSYRSISFSEMDDIQIRAKDGVSSKLVYRGFVDNVIPTLQIDQQIVLEIKGYFSQLKKLVIHSSGDTKIYTNKEISVLVTNIIDNFVTPHSFITKGTIDAGSFTCDSIKFLCPVSEALQTLVELAGNIEYGVDEDLVFFWRTESTTIRHKFIVGNNIQRFERRINYEKIINKLYLIGGDVTGVKYKKTAQSVPIGTVTSGPFTAGETITGGTSGATGKVLKAIANGDEYMYFSSTNALNFQSAEIITGGSSGASATIGTILLSEKIINNGSITTDIVAEQYLLAILEEKTPYEININGDIVNTLLRLEDTIPIGKIIFYDASVNETAYSSQVDRISYELSNTPGRFNIKVEIGDTVLETAARIKRLEMAMRSAEQN